MHPSISLTRFFPRKGIYNEIRKIGIIILKQNCNYSIITFDNTDLLRCVMLMDDHSHVVSHILVNVS